MPAAYLGIAMKIKLPEIKKPDIKMPEFKKPQLNFNVDDGMLRKVWAGEIAAGVLLSLVSIIVAFAG